MPLPFPIELFLWTACLFLLFLGLTVPLGSLIISRLFLSVPRPLQLLTALGVSVAIYGAELTALVLLDLPAPAIRTALAATAIGAALAWWRSASRELLLESWRPIALMGCYLFLTVSTAAYPAANFRDISPASVDALMALPIDNLLPYNFSRYLLSEIAPNSIDVFPGWRAGERGPLAALFNAVVFYLMGIEDRGGWLEVTPGYFFIYHTLLSFLNLFSMFAAYALAEKHFGRRAAVLACVMLMTSYFYFVNALFSWPKLLSAYYILTALLIAEERSQRANVLCGVFLALAPLSHDSALFSAIAYFAFLTLSTLWLTRSFPSLLRGIGTPFCGFMVTYLPWLAFKTLYTKPSSRLLYMHLFCDTREGIEGTPFREYLNAYLAKYTPLEIVGIRLQNIWYPFDVTALFDRLALYWHDPLTLINFVASDTFLRFLYSVGIPLAIVFLMAIWRLRRTAGYRALLVYIVVGFATLPFVAAISGCANNTVNHIWAYPAFLAVSVAVGALVARSGWVTHLLFSIGCALNSVVGVIYIHLHSHLRPFLHGSSGYFLTQLAAVLTLATLTGLLYLTADEGEVP